MLFPYSLKDGSLSRMPVVSIGLVVANTLVFLITYVGLGLPELNVESTRPGDPGMDVHLDEAVRYWQKYSYLSIPDDCYEAMPSAMRIEMEMAEDMALLRNQDLVDSQRMPGEKLRESQQFELNALCNEALVSVMAGGTPIAKKQEVSEAVEESWLIYGLIPARGFFQLGWLLHMFLHGGWLHLIFNMFFFFFLAGPFLEDVWGRPFYTAFYLVGGLFAGLTHYLGTSAAAVPMIGASGAIAACTGAFCVRFAARELKFVYWIAWFWRGAFVAPAWIWGIYWFGGELMQYWLVGDFAGVAFLAHIGGFAFGAVFAAVMMLGGLEKRYLSAKVDKLAGGWERNPRMDEGLAALQAGDEAGARAAFEALLAEDPLDQDAALELARLQVKAGEQAAATTLLTPIIERDMRADNSIGLVALFDELGDALLLDQLPPQLLYDLGQYLESRRARHAARCFEAAAAVGGNRGSSALLRAASLLARADRDPRPALAVLDRVLAVPDLPPGTFQKATMLRDELAERPIPRIQERHERPSVIEIDAPPVRALQARFAGGDADGVQVERLDGKGSFPMRFDAILGVAVGVIGEVSSGEETLRNTLVIDIVSDWGLDGQPTQVVRFFSNDMGLGRLFPSGTDPIDAIRRLLGSLHARSKGRALPTEEAVAGAFPRYESLPAFELACYS